MCCGATKRPAGPVQVIRAQPKIGRSLAPRPQSIPVGGGARAQAIRQGQVKRCPKCSWPMNSLRRFDGIGRTIQVWACLNRKCMYKVET